MVSKGRLKHDDYTLTINSLVGTRYGVRDLIHYLLPYHWRGHMETAVILGSGVYTHQTQTREEPILEKYSPLARSYKCSMVFSVCILGQKTCVVKDRIVCLLSWLFLFQCLLIYLI